MFKKFLAVFFAALMIFTVGCGKKDETSSNADVTESTTSIPENDETNEGPTVINPLTGIAEFDDVNMAYRRPVAIMINNYCELGNYSVQKVQTGLAKADIIYETEAEGGITRLLAVYQDISKAEKIGTIRSARYQHVDLAMGHNAIYIHSGVNAYCKPHLKDVDDLDIADGTYGGEKLSNGQSSTEHTLYAWSDKLWESIENNFNTTSKSAASWVNFTQDEIKLDGGTATSVAVPFPTQTTRFTYDEQSGLYTRVLGSSVQSDYFTKESTQVKNVFVLMTSMSRYDDNYTRKVDLKSGTGYYITNGTMKEIKWTKGAASNGFKFTDVNGKELEVSAGNSWVCIANKSTCTPTFE